MEFNKLLEQQVQLMRQMQSSGASTLTTSNGTHMPTCKIVFAMVTYSVSVDCDERFLWLL